MMNVDRCFSMGTPLVLARRRLGAIEGAAQAIKDAWEGEPCYETSDGAISLIGDNLVVKVGNVLHVPESRGGDEYALWEVVFMLEEIARKQAEVLATLEAPTVPPAQKEE